MTIRQWYQWLISLPLVLRWFPIVVVLRPAIDSFYHLKEVSIFLSPPFIVGVLTPVLCLQAFRSAGTASASDSSRMMNLWCWLLFIVMLVFLIKHLSVEGIKVFLKVAFPAYLFMFLKRFVYSIDDLHGILFTFILAAYFAALFMLYEIINGPIQEVVFTRGMQRYRGTFADVVSYSIYISLGFLSSAYFYLGHTKIKIFGINNLYIFLVFTLLAVFKISHMATYGVVVALIVLLIISSLNKKPGGAFILIILVIGGLSYFGTKVFEQNIQPLIEKDLMVLEGEREQEALLHGRVGRWQTLWQRFQRNHLLAKFLGTPIDNPSAYMITSGSHNDFLRIIFTTGYIGFGLYLLALFNFWWRSRAFDGPERFLAVGTLTILILYSITTTPTYYVNFMYIFLSILCFFHLDPEQAYGSEEEVNSEF